MGNVTDLELARQQKLNLARQEKLVEVEVGLIRNIHDALLHSFQHLESFRRSQAATDLKWAVLSVVQAGELLSNVLLIRSRPPVDKLFPKKGAGKELDFHPPSFNKSLLTLLVQHGSDCCPPIIQEEIDLLKTAEGLANTRNELMHRTLVTLDDKEQFARTALSILLVFEFRFYDIEFPISEGCERLDTEAATLMHWISPDPGDSSSKGWQEGHRPAFIKSAIKYLKSVGFKETYPQCPMCGSSFVSENFCRACRIELCSVECGDCGNNWYEQDQHGVPDTCPDCDASKDNFHIRCRY